MLASLLADLAGLQNAIDATEALRVFLRHHADDVARYLAQWAINVVNFRDRDSIMTPFDFDPFFAARSRRHPITGWNPPDDAAHRVWGCKRPELLISETLAFHDRRTEDTALEKVDPTNTNGEPVYEPRTHHRSNSGPGPQFRLAIYAAGIALCGILQSLDGQEPRPAGVF